MKIAFCFSGHLRGFFDKEVSLFENRILDLISKNHSVNVFFSVWDTFHGVSNKARDYVYESNLDRVDERVFDDFSKKYDTKFEIQKFKDLKHKFYLKDIHPSIKPENDLIITSDGMLYSTPMFYKIYRANLMKSNYEILNGFTFDLVIRYRANNLIGSLNFNHVMPNKLYNGNAHNGNACYRGEYAPVSYMMNDQFFYGDSDTMNTVCDLYNNLDLIMNKYEGNPSYIGPERLLYDWVVYENSIDNEISPIEFDYWH